MFLGKLFLIFSRRTFYKCVLQRTLKHANEFVDLTAGRYYDFDTSQSGHHDSIMADQLAGHWFMKASQLEDDSVSGVDIYTIHTCSATHVEAHLLCPTPCLPPSTPHTHRHARMHTHTHTHTPILFLLLHENQSWMSTESGERVWPRFKALGLGLIPLRLLLLFKSCGLWTLPLTINETLEWLSSLPICMQESFW